MAKILIVDDQPHFRRVLRLVLGVKGYDVREAASAADAMGQIRTERPDLILVDWLMPDVDGIRLCRAIRDTSDVPIIMVTSKPDGRSQALAAGADDYITKPFGNEDLLAHIESALAR